MVICNTVLLSAQHQCQIAFFVTHFRCLGEHLEYPWSPESVGLEVMTDKASPARLLSNRQVGTITTRSHRSGSHVSFLETPQHSAFPEDLTSYFSQRPSSLSRTPSTDSAVITPHSPSKFTPRPRLNRPRSSSLRAPPLERYGNPTLFSNTQLFIQQSLSNIFTTISLLLLVVCAMLAQISGRTSLHLSGRPRDPIEREWDDPERFKHECTTRDPSYYARFIGYDMQSLKAITRDGFHLRVHRITAPGVQPGGYPVCSSKSRLP